MLTPETGWMLVLAWSPSRVISSAAMLAGAVILLVLVGVVVRRLVVGRGDQAPAQRAGLTLREMRRMHEAGELSDEEFEAVKASLARRMEQAEDRGGGGARR